MQAAIQNVLITLIANFIGSLPEMVDGKKVRLKLPFGDKMTTAVVLQRDGKLTSRDGKLPSLGSIAKRGKTLGKEMLADSFQTVIQHGGYRWVLRTTKGMRSLREFLASIESKETGQQAKQASMRSLMALVNRQGERITRIEAMVEKIVNLLESNGGAPPTPRRNIRDFVLQ